MGRQKFNNMIPRENHTKVFDCMLASECCAKGRTTSTYVLMYISWQFLLQKRPSSQNSEGMPYVPQLGQQPMSSVELLLSLAMDSVASTKLDLISKY